MPDLSAPAYWLARLIIERGLAAVYFVAFLVALKQFPALCGDRGLTPARVVLERTTFFQSPSLFHLGYSDRRLRGVAWAGLVISAALVLGLPQQAALPVTITASGRCLRYQWLNSFCVWPCRGKIGMTSLGSILC